ncbi:MAG: UDP-N-acetylglucosamine 2-epimerase [Candidatus Aenigmatarchaeota archaeon]
MEKTLIILDSRRGRIPTTIKFVSSIYNSIAGLHSYLTFNLKVIPTIKKLSKKKELVIVALDHETNEKLDRAGIACRNHNDYISADFYKIAEEDAMKFIINIEKYDKFKNAVTHDGCSLWEIVRADSWNYFSRIFSDISLAEKIINREKPEHIHIFDTGSQMGSITYSIAKSRGAMVTGKASWFNKIRRMLIPFAMRFVQPWGTKRLKPCKRLHFDKVGKLIVIPISSNFRFAVITPWINKIKNDVVFLSIDESKSSIGRTEHVSSYITKDVAAKTKIMESAFKESLSELKKDEKFRNMLSYKNTDLYDSSILLFEFYLKHDFPELVKHIEALKNFIEEGKPDLLINYDEIGRWAKLYDMVSSRHIPVLLSDHGVIDVGYPKDGNVYASKIAAFGQMTKDFWARRGVERKRIEITGDPRYDELFLKKMYYNKNSVYEKFGIPKDKTIVVLTTQPVSKEENEALLHGVFKAIEEFPDLQLIVKLHPDENDELHKKIANEYDIKPIIVKCVDLYELFNSCGLAITYYSTTALEAMLFDKPVLIVNLSGQPDKFPFVSSGAAVGAYMEKDIAPSIKNIINNKALRKRLESARRRLITKSIYKTDGKSAERFAKLVEQVLK